MPDRLEDDLFSPSLAGFRRGAPPPGERPWRLGSQFYVAVFGGPVAAGLVGYENGKRLGLPARRLGAIAAVALAALAGVAIAAVLLDSEDSRPLQLVVMVAGAAAYVPIRELQRDADRGYRVGRNEDASYDSLWRLGIGAVVVGIVLAGLVMLGVTV